MAKNNSANAKKKTEEVEQIKPNTMPKAHKSRHNELSSGAKSSMRTRTISAIVGVILLFPAIFLGDWIFFALITIALAIACWEILGCANKRAIPIFIIYFLFVASIAYWPLFKTMIISGITSPKIDSYFNIIYLSALVVVVGSFLLFLLTVIYKDFSIVSACFLLTMAVLIGFGFQCIFYLRYAPVQMFAIDTPIWTFNVDNTVKTSLLLLFVIVGTFATDAGAYFVGVFFGKNKMNERISPKKTWEGFVGGIFISAFITAGIGFAFAGFNYPIAPFLDLSHWYYIVIIALILPVFATLGDFVFSSIKRYWGIKDYGKLIPGHGGVLDRLDSIFFASIISAIFFYMVSPTANGGAIIWEQFLI